VRPTPPYRIFIGWDASQMRAWNIAQYSLKTTTQQPVDIQRIAMRHLRQMGLYRRPTALTEHGYWDDLSCAPMSTGHAIARFLVPALCGYEGWALFTDGDVLFRSDVAALFALADPAYAVQVVQHQHVPHEATKMEGETQTRYARKNWSSVMLFHCGHPANQALTVDLVNTAPGRDLHAFCWLPDDLIGELPAEWNVLIGEEAHPNPSICHFTLGLPDMPGYEHVEYADAWYAAARRCGYRLARPDKAVA